MSRLAFIGGGGFAKEALEIAQLSGHDVVGYVGDSEGVLDRHYWGEPDALLSRRAAFDAVCITFGAVSRKSLLSRARMVQWVRDNGWPAQSLISPHATVSAGASVAEGAFVAHRSVISVDASIGPFVILNTGSIIGHDAVIGSNCTIAPGAFVAGMTHVGSDCLVGPGATVLQGLNVGAEVVIGVGASVVRDVAPGATVFPLRSKIVG